MHSRQTRGIAKGHSPLPAFFWVLFLAEQEKDKPLGYPDGPNNVGRLGKGGTAEGVSIGRQADANDMQHVTPRGPGPQPQGNRTEERPLHRLPASLALDISP